MMREYWNLQENLMISAWKEGGEVDGQVVTDDRLLNFWLERRDAMDRDDPLWDHYNNLHSQYDFAIRESEVGLKYAEKKMSAREVARWYTSESKKYPRYSEIYRTIAGQAAKFMDAARAGAKQSNYDGQVKAYTRLSNENARENLWPHQIILQGLTEAFRYYGILEGSQNEAVGTDTAIPELGQGEQLTDLSFRQGDTQMWNSVLDVLSTPGTELHQWFQANVMDPARREGLEVNMPLDQQDLEALMHRATGGYHRQMDINNRFHEIAPKGSNDDMRRGARDVVDLFQFLYVLDDEVPIYAERRAALDQVRNDPTADPFARLRAYGEYYEDLGKLVSTVGAQNPVMTTALNVERRYLMGDTSGGNALISEDVLLSPFGNVAQGEEGAAMASETLALRDTVEKLSTGQFVATIDPVTRQWGAMHVSEARAQFGTNYVLIPKVATQVSWVPGTSTEDRLLGRGRITQGGSLVYGQLVASKPITAVAPSSAPDPNTGQYLGAPLPAYQSTTLGQVASVPNPDGSVTQLYGIYVGGKLRWTAENPFVGQFQRQDTPDGVTLIVDPIKTPKAVAGIDPTTGQPMLDQRGGPVGPTAPDADIAFNPRSVINESLFSRNSVFSYNHPSLALLSSTPEYRQTAAGMSAQQMVDYVGAGPQIMDWNDPAEVNELVSDFGAIKAAGSVSPTAGAKAEFDFYRQLNTVRNPENPNLYLNAPDPIDFAAQTFLQKGIRVAGLDFDQRFLPSGFGEALATNRIGGNVGSYMGRSVNDIIALERRSWRPTAPITYTPEQQAAMAAQAQPASPSNMTISARYLPGGVPIPTPLGGAGGTGKSTGGSWGTPGYGAPTIQASGNVKLPLMPGGVNLFQPTYNPLPGALSPPTPPPTPTPTYAPPPPTAPRPPTYTPPAPPVLTRPPSTGYRPTPY